jgi:hypothetical protein
MDCSSDSSSVRHLSELGRFALPEDLFRVLIESGNTRQGAGTAAQALSPRFGSGAGSDDVHLDLDLLPFGHAEVFVEFDGPAMNDPLYTCVSRSFALDESPP